MPLIEDRIRTKKVTENVSVDEFPVDFLTSARLAVVGRLFSGGAPSLHDVPSLPVPEQLRQDWRRLLQPGGEDNQVNPCR